jgi:hypothetical protein
VMLDGFLVVGILALAALLLGLALRNLAE